MLEALHNFFNVFGAATVVPVMIFIVSLFLKVNPKRAFFCALRAGVGLTGFGWIISAFAPMVTKYIQQMVDTTGLNLPIVDIGWQAGSLTAFSSEIGLSFFVFGLLIELVLFLTGITRVFVPSNLWNNFGYMIWGTMAYAATGNFVLSFAFMVFVLLYSLVMSEVLADRWSEYYGVKNATINSIHNIETLIPALILDPLWNLLGINKVKLNPESLKTKLGIFGEPMTLGFILGVIIGVLGSLKNLMSIETWGGILSFAVALAAVMTIFPLITGVFAQAFAPLAEAVERNKKKENAESSTLSDKKRWFIAVDDGVGFGEPATIIAGLVLVPIMVVISLILPGNKALPVVDLIAIPFMIEAMIAITRGNILKAILNGIVWFSLGLYAASALGPIYTEAVKQFGTALPAGVTLIMSFNLLAHPLTALVLFAWISGNPIYIGLTIVTYLAFLVLLRTRREAIYRYLKVMSDKNSGFEGSCEKIFIAED
ncbi:UNVERIFIED_CONTAM: PTS galactitol transporter subunit IIC [Streptococcus canis]|uniref:PTS system, IIC component, putative n=1 Tax=Streptococcus canis FSL Z3-227 TaxID=482234 RepID=A0AAV3FV68_STRCB|nr:PTS transporter subunit IIC [Streptococcus canis]EIQ82829.1 PTS system, IIC component, putative [Streptococcus canis FSL Z3-227]MDV5988422.1 PTS galactitol transporter subunit IIC [Streptococcus canis]MDV5992897.1 PTS galactitol transporter subunit IIC [Streptococcus canis]MDV6022229.1 PTS galactitol transporter subunit IIC [Streptococcus canis]MDW7798965.1 PTS transporter subunit IIC [Streptococcus canis]